MESKQQHDVEFASQRPRRLYSDQEQPALLTLYSRGRFDYGVLRSCLILTTKLSHPKDYVIVDFVFVI